jgi:hypothetical protein
MKGPRARKSVSHLAAIVVSFEIVVSFQLPTIILVYRSLFPSTQPANSSKPVIHFYLGLPDSQLVPHLFYPTIDFRQNALEKYRLRSVPVSIDIDSI